MAEIETQFTRLDASVAALRRAQANLKRYRASVLKDACEGRLVPTEAELARSEGREYEPAAVLLERILAERRARWESQEKRLGASTGNPLPPTSPPSRNCRRGGCGQLCRNWGNSIEENRNTWALVMILNCWAGRILSYRPATYGTQVVW